MRPFPADRASTVKSTAELWAIAGDLLHQAIDLYHQLGERMKVLGNEKARQAFENLETLQREHAGASFDHVSGETPLVFLPHGLDETRLVTPYMAYSVAVRNQERAFAFWSHVSAHATDPAVRSEAERLAHVELDHVRTLRAERRRAYRERDANPRAAEPSRTASLSDFRRDAAAREAALASLHGRIAAALAAAQNPYADGMAAIAREEADTASNLGLARSGEIIELASDEPDKLLGMAIEHLEAAVEFYLTVAERSEREDVVAAAQDLADRAIMRLSRPLIRPKP